MMARVRSREVQRTIGEAIRAQLATLDPSGHLEDYALWERWEEIVGPTLARQTRPLRLRNHLLLVGVTSSTWMQELQFLKGRLRCQINDALGRSVVRETRFVLAPPLEPPQPRRYRRRPPGPPPRLGALPTDSRVATALQDLWHAWVRAANQPRR